ncbi:hypothetical protein BC936DRAFT_146190 [Jimgerdemannia flammicorona]|uniref:Arrestin C-terminal-like domain-containing protein n=1 Tax=Jimgerdemannia flammicorona TaxID=994334 RepID=A0A433D852_9FUNG|nr:hypothetical protein BC936DRAFT_146190 [Jimgerdemannia flammicorona]
MRAISDFSITVDNEYIDFFGPPNPSVSATLRGKIQLVLTKPLTIKNLSLKLTGKSAVASVYYYFKVVKREDAVLAENRELPEGTTELTWQFKLPGDLPPSFKINVGSCDYQLSALLICDKTLFGSNKTRRYKDIHISRSLISSLDLAQSLPPMVYKGKREGIIEYKFFVPKVICTDETETHLSLQIKTLQDVGRVKKVVVTLEQNERFLNPWGAAARAPEQKQAASDSSSNSDASGTGIEPGGSNRHNQSFMNTETTPGETEAYANYSDPANLDATVSITLPLNKVKLHPRIKTTSLEVTHHIMARVVFVHEQEQKDLWVHFPIPVSMLPFAPPGIGDIPSVSTIEYDLPTYDTTMEGTELPSYTGAEPPGG